MNEQDYELLSQYLDGELPGLQAQALRERLMAEPQLRASFEGLRSVDKRVKEAFDVPGADAVPARVTRMLENASTRPAPQRRAVWGFAVAASLVAATGLLLSPDWRQSSPGQATVDALLAQILEQTPSRGQDWDALPDGRQVRPLLSFQNKAGGWCREYLMSAAGQTWRGVACRRQDNWATEILSPELFNDPAGEYRPAGASNPVDISSYINTHAADIPLSLKQEAELITRHWQ